MSINFTPRCQEIVALAKKLALKFNNEDVTLDHFLLSFLKVDSILIPFIEQKLKIEFSSIEKLAYNAIKSEKTSKNLESVSFSLPVQSCLDFAYEISNQKNHSYVSVEHLFYALLNEPSSHVIDYFLSLS